MAEPNFSEQLARLKQSVGMYEDQQVAELLGLTKAAFSDRKRRGAFPVDKLRALAAGRPDLKVDVSYVLEGHQLPAHAFRAIAEHPEKTLHVGRRLTQVRHGLGLTQPELAQLLGVDVSTLDGIEAGRRALTDEVLNGMWAGLGALRYFIEHGDGDLVTDSSVLGQPFTVTPTMVGGQLRYIVRANAAGAGSRVAKQKALPKPLGGGSENVVVSGGIQATGRGSMAAGRDISVGASPRSRRKAG